jgi:tetratricopeptide (TPR) repeat protein
VGLNQPQLAVGEFERALQYDPHNINTYLNTGLAYSSLGQSRDALEVFKRGMETAKRGQETEHLVQFMIYCGQLYEQLEEEQEALKMYHDALVEGPDYSQVWYLAGCIYANQEKKEQAQKYFSEAIQCSVPWPSAYYKLSKIVDDPEEKKKLYSMFVEAQKELAYLEGKQRKGKKNSSNDSDTNYLV